MTGKSIGVLISLLIVLFNTGGCSDEVRITQSLSDEEVCTMFEAYCLEAGVSPDCSLRSDNFVAEYSNIDFSSESDSTRRLLVAPLQCAANVAMLTNIVDGYINIKFKNILFTITTELAIDLISNLDSESTLDDTYYYVKNNLSEYSLQRTSQPETPSVCHAFSLNVIMANLDMMLPEYPYEASISDYIGIYISGSGRFVDYEPIESANPLHQQGYEYIAILYINDSYNQIAVLYLHSISDIVTGRKLDNGELCYYYGYIDAIEYTKYEVISYILVDIYE